MSSYNGCWWTCFNPSWVGRWTNLHCSFMCCCSGTSATPAILSLEQNFPGFGARKWLVICRDILLLAGENLPQFPVMLWDSSYHHFLKAECSVSLFCFPCNCLQIHKTLLLSQLSFVDAMLSVYYSYNLICICYKSIWAMWSSLYESVWWNGDFFFFVKHSEGTWFAQFLWVLWSLMSGYMLFVFAIHILFWLLWQIICMQTPWWLFGLGFSNHCRIYHMFEVLKWVTGICNRVTFMCLGDNREVGFDWSQGKLLWLEHI